MLYSLNFDFIFIFNKTCACETQMPPAATKSKSPGPSEARYLAVSLIFGFFMKLFALTLSHKPPI